MQPRDWRCSTCNKRFLTQSAAAQHIAASHPRKGGQAVHEPRRRDDGDLQEWQYIHLARGWPI